MKNLLTFLLLVSILAPLSATAAFSIQPSACDQKFVPPCAVLTHSKMEFTLPGIKIYLSKNALVEFQGSNAFYLVRGIAWVQTERAMVVRHKFGEAKVSAGSDIWFEAGGNEWVIKSIKNFTAVHPRGGAEPTPLQEGHEMYLGGVDYEAGAAFASVPLVIDLRRHFANLAKVFPFQRLNLQDYTHNLGRVVVAAAEENSQWLKMAAERKIATVEKTNIRRKTEAKALVHRDTYLRRLFLQKSNFED